MSTHRPRRAPRPASPVSLAAVTVLTVGALIALSGHASPTTRLVGAALAAWGLWWCRATLHQQPRWTTRRIVARAIYRTIGAGVEAGVREVRLLMGPPRGRHSVGSNRRAAGAW